MATAFLFNQDKVLMMKKNLSRIFDFEFWSGLGGHLEPEELNEPKGACVREIFEESGIQEEEIEDLKLQYILLRVKNDEIRQQFVYFGKTNRSDAVASEEGELYWIHKDEILNLHVSRIIRFMIEHYFSNPDKTEVTIGTISIDNNDEDPVIQWAELRDPGVF
ncbi:hypothetical protein GCM10008013_28420 [Paenibacillus segetis]|uniref:Nudix hydrolase domain-containing protein n=2 Tax=Paenibacillus segetis TaxID=1325360 RepID=A0ABQ1YJQ6_9BACL|nr:hypothetical protein GCM10008013_28420 [Paenibacillus segetis]